MAQSQIKWKQGDYVKLGKAVSEFNKKVNELRNEENKLYLPETIKYKDSAYRQINRNLIKDK